MKCNDCPAFYIGQTGREFHIRYKEHLPKIKTTSDQKSNFAQHLVSNNHNYTDFETNLEVIHVCNKGRYLNALEEYEIYKHIQIDPDNVLNDQLKFKSNYINDTAIHMKKKNNKQMSNSDMLPVVV